MAIFSLVAGLVVYLVGDLYAVTGLISLDALGVLAPIRDAISQILTGFGITFA